MEKEREDVRKEKIEQDYAAGKAAEGAEDDEGFQEEASTGIVGAKHSTGHQRGSTGAKMSVRNLRIREDTAKYLRNLDPGSAFYDPKTRSMRANPYASLGKEGDELYMGDNFERMNGDASSQMQQTFHTYEAYEKGQDIHQEALPTQAERVHKDFITKKANVLSKRQQEMLEKYGGTEHLEKMPQELMIQSEGYVEFDRRGAVVGGLAKALPSTKYPENVFENGHTQVWGSYGKLVGEDEMVWGYGCCKQTTRFCAPCGDCKENMSPFFPREAAPKASSPKQLMPPPAAKASSPKGPSPSPRGASLPSRGDAAEAQKEMAMEAEAEARYLAKQEEAAAERAASLKRKMQIGDDLPDQEELDPKAVKRALKKLKKQKKKDNDVDDRDRGYNSLAADVDVTAEQMEAYKQSKGHWEDPMNKMADTT